MKVVDLKGSFNVVISDYTINIIEGEKRTELFSICEMHAYPIYIFVLQDSVRVNVTTLKDDGEVSKEQVCLLQLFLMYYLASIMQPILFLPTCLI